MCGRRFAENENVVRIVCVWMNGCAAAKHKASRGSQHFRAKANNRVDDLQGMVSELQQARREGRLKDVALLEEQMHQMLREWKAELREASPASSLLVQHELMMMVIVMMLFAIQSHLYSLGCL